MWMLLTALAACGARGDDTGEVGGPACEETAIDLALDAETGLGFTAQDVLDLAQGSHTETFHPMTDDAPESQVTVVAAWTTGAVHLIESEAVYPDSGTHSAIGVVCEDRVEVVVDVTLDTDDGQLAEAWSLKLRATVPEQVIASVSVSEFAGTVDLWDFADPDADTVSGAVSLRWSPSGSHGEVGGQATGEDDCETGDPCSAWAQSFQIGWWSVDDER